jgi:2-polyprenyl-6-methoxyphenol hydroxylase-like FAD-dependent oxidoreductase
MFAARVLREERGADAHDRPAESVLETVKSPPRRRHGSPVPLLPLQPFSHSLTLPTRSKTEALIPLDLSDLPTRHGYVLALRQESIERTLAAWVDELAVPTYRGLEVTGFAQDDTGVDVELGGGRSLRAEYLVGCDGGRSLIRKKAGIDFPGWDPSLSYLIAEVAMTEEPAWGIRRDERGINGLAKLEDGKRVRVVLNEPHVRQGDEPTLDDLRQALIAL